jgi:ABC-type Fe3+/spermidine/putrescine transport system ATPase subunit
VRDYDYRHAAAFGYGKLGVQTRERFLMKSVQLTNVSKHYAGQPVICDFSLEIEQGERIVIFGPSGCGKTTLLRLLAGFISPDSGSIMIDGERVAADARIIKQPEDRNLGMVFQDLALWPHLTVKGNLDFGLKAKGLPKRARQERIAEILRLMQMEPFIHTRPAELSGGQQQRVALARALVLRPKVLLMDEPLSALELELNIRLRKEINKLQQSIGFTLIYVTHDREEAVDIASRVVVMKNGKIWKDSADRAGGRSQGVFETS